ncbi:hypothetical protein [Marinobacter sp.]
MTHTFKVLCISGGLRENPYNTAAIMSASGLGDWTRKLQAGSQR